MKNKTCKHCKIDFSITDKDLEFYEKVSPVFNWKKYDIPTPTFCSDCRQQRRLAFRNERNLYKRTCDGAWKPIISMYKSGSPYTVYDMETWWWDSWDPFSYWKDFDFSKSFFEQFKKLSINVPKLNLIVSNNYNSEYVNLETDSKNCYMNIGGHFNTDSFYNLHIFNSEDCVDSYWLDNCFHCYKSLKCFDSRKLFYSYWCYSCKDSYYCSFSRNLENCFGCVHLENKEYHILNKEYSQEQYEEKIKILLSDPAAFQDFLDSYDALVLSLSEKNNTIQNSENISWDDIKDSHNALEVYGVEDVEDVKYVSIWVWIQDTYDCTRLWFEISQCYEIMWWTNLHRAFFSTYVLDGVSDSFYLDNCHTCKYLFGCVWLRNKQYCILNKQYTKEEYEQLVPKIIEKMKQDWVWCEFFPSSLSPFGYNETVANEYFPLTKEEALKKWFNWSDYEAPFPKVEKIIPAEKLPQNIEDIPDDILNWAIECEVTKKPFRIIKPELEFYRKHNLWIPKRHPDQRHLDRMNLINI